MAHGLRTVASYGEFARRAAVLAGHLRGPRFGFAPGERIAVAMRNVPEYPQVLYGIWHAGLAAVPINAKLHAKEFEYVLAHSGARLCFVTDDLAPVIGNLVADLPDLIDLIRVGSPDFDRLVQGDPLPLTARQPTDLAWLFYTSGTTGRPKGAMLTHRNLMAMTLSYFADVDSVSSEDSVLHAGPMSHGSGMYILPHVTAAATQVIPEGDHFDPSEIFALISGHHGVSFFAAPTMVRRLVESHAAASADTRNLKTIIYGGGPRYVADCKRALDVLGPKLAQIYGQGESPMTITALSKTHHRETRHPRYERRLASVGCAQSVCEVRLAGPDGTSLPTGSPGEVVVRGDSVMAGYWHDDAATAHTIRDGWLHTGDIGVFDEDGFLTLKDRTKDMIISGGSNIYPREVEEVLLTHPKVAEIAVVGAPHADWGEEVVAFVVSVDGAPIPVAELDEFCLHNFARFKRPKQYHFVEALPKNNYGKVLKRTLRDTLQVRD